MEVLPAVNPQGEGDGQAYESKLTEEGSRGVIEQSSTRAKDRDGEIIQDDHDKRNEKEKHNEQGRKRSKENASTEITSSVDQKSPAEDLRPRNTSSALENINSLLNSGVYIPPGKRRQLLQEAEKEKKRQKEDNNSIEKDETAVGETTKSSAVIQRQTWNEQKKIVNGTINRLNKSTIKPLIHDLFDKVNLIRLRGVLARSLLQAAMISVQYSDTYAALVAVINTKLPEIGELVVKRAILSFQRHFKRKDKASCLAMATFLGHLFHQGVVHELLILQILMLLLDGDPTDDSVEVVAQFLPIVGQKLLEASPAGVRAVLERLRSLLHEGTLNSRVEYKIEGLLKIRKMGFCDYPSIIDELDLVNEDDQILFEISLEEKGLKKEDSLDIFRVDENYDENERTWSGIRAEILGLGDSDDSGDENVDDDDNSSETDDSDEEEESDDDQDKNANIPEHETAIVPAQSQAVVTQIQDLSESDLIHLRRTIYLTIMSSATFEECTHKLTKVDIPIGREEELVNMILECCSQERTFLRYYGLICSRFCLMDQRWQDAFLTAFSDQYNTIHRLETNKLRNVAKLFAHLLHTDAVPWSCLSCVHLNEDETTSSSRIFLKILLQEMAEALGISKLKARLEKPDDPVHVEWYKGMFPKDNVRNTRYAINFFTSIGLGPLTDELREFLKNAPKLILAKAQEEAAAKLAAEDDDDSSVSSSSSSTSDSSSSLSTSSYTSSSSSSSSSSDSRRGRYRRGRRSRNRRRSARERRRRRSPSYSSDSTSDSGSSTSRSSYSSYSSRGRRSASSGSTSRSGKRSRRHVRGNSDRDVGYRRGRRSPSDSYSTEDRSGKRRSPASLSRQNDEEYSGKRRRDSLQRNRQRSFSNSPDPKARKSYDNHGGKGRGDSDKDFPVDTLKRSRRHSRSTSPDSISRGRRYDDRKRSRRSPSHSP